MAALALTLAARGARGAAAPGPQTAPPAAGPAGAPATAAAPAARPAFEVGADRVLFAALPAYVLSHSEVKPRLTSGLTTSLALSVTATDAQGKKARGGGLVEVRYELWDEVFLATAVGSDGRRMQASLPTLDRLIAWWQALRLPVLAAGRAFAPGPWHIVAHLAVSPFSRGEQAQTQDWVSRSVAGAPAADTRSEETVTTGPVGGVLDMLVATSIKRRSVVSFDWHADVAAGAAPAPAPAGGAPP